MEVLRKLHDRESLLPSPLGLLIRTRVTSSGTSFSAAILIILLVARRGEGTKHNP